MNEEINIEQQLQIELTRLRKAVDYIEQADKTAQQIQRIREHSQLRYKFINENIDILKNDLTNQISDLNKKNKEVVNKLDDVSKIIKNQNIIIEQNQKEIERLKNLKWYQKLFG